MAQSTRVRRRGYTFAQLPEWVLYHPDLSPRAVRLFAVLDRFAGDSDDCYPSRKKLAEKLACSPATVDRALAQLVKAGAVEVTRRRRDAEDGGQTSNLYTLLGTDPSAKGAEGATQECIGGVLTDDEAPSSDSRPQEVEPVEVEPLNENSSALASEELAATAHGLCLHLAQRIEANGSNPPQVTQRWLSAARLMIERDGRDPVKAHRLIDWCQDDEFEQAVILSMPKFRARYDSLRLKANRSVKAARPKESAAMSKGRRAAAAAARRPATFGELSA